jgi:hypothetical protein
MHERALALVREARVLLVRLRFEIAQARLVREEDA